MSKVFSIVFLLVMFGQSIRADISHLTLEEIEQITLDRIIQVSFEEYIIDQQADYQEVINGVSTSQPEPFNADASSESSLHLVLRLRAGQEGQIETRSSGERSSRSDKIEPTTTSGEKTIDNSQEAATAGNNYVDPSVVIDRSGLSKGDFSTLTLDLQRKLTSLRNQEQRALVSQKENSDSEKFKTSCWSYSCGERATSLINSGNYKKFKTLLKVMPDDDLIKQGWIRSLAQENMHPLLLLEHSNILLTQQGDKEQALAFYLLGLRRLIEDTERLWAGDSAKYLMIKRVFSYFTKQYGSVFRDQDITRADRKQALELGKDIYRDWRNNYAIEKVSKSGNIRHIQSDKSLVNPRWLVTYGQQYKLNVHDAYVLPKVKNPMCSDSFHASETVQFLLHSSDTELFGPNGPGQLVHRLTHRYHGGKN